jgi:uncharacterized protein YgiM (DUF1202 family)
MKRLLFVMMLLLATMAVNAQKDGFVCTGNNVNVRTGPGKNFPIYDIDTGNKRQLSKGKVVANCGKKENGFCLVRGPLEWGGDEREGWVSAQYLRPVTLCAKCFGTGNMNISKDEIDLRTCNKCKGKGYIK